MTTPARVADVDTPAVGPSEASEPQVPDGHGHDVDRALAELLGEIRIAQMGAQILLGFLLAVAYTAALRDASTPDRALYAWAVGVTTGAVVLLLATVPLHRLNFGRRARPDILVVGHVLAVAGLALLGAAIVLSVWMAARIADPSMVTGLLVPITGLLVLTWVALPLGLRMRSRPPTRPPQA